MSAAKRQARAQAHAAAPEAAAETANGTEERRSHPDSQYRDRRVIARADHPELRKYFSQARQLCRLWVALSAFYIFCLVGANLTVGKIALGRSLFYGVVVTVIAVAVKRLELAIQSYLTSESQAKLITAVERCFMLIFVCVVLGTVLGAVHLITLF